MPRKAEPKRVKQGGKPKAAGKSKQTAKPDETADEIAREAQAEKEAADRRVRIILKYPYLQDKAGGRPDDRWNWEKVTHPDTGKVFESWMPDETVPERESFPSPELTPEDNEAFVNEFLDMMNHRNESPEDRRRRFCSELYDRALEMREAKPSLPSIPAPVDNPTVDERNLRQWRINAGLPSLPSMPAPVDDPEMDKENLDRWHIEAQAKAQADKPGMGGEKTKGRPQKYTPEEKAACKDYYLEWRTFHAAWQKNGKKGAARTAFAKSKKVSQRKSDTMIRYGAPTRKKSRIKSRG